MQDIFIQVWTARDSLPEIRNFRNFLLVIAKHAALNALRSALREKARTLKWEQSNTEERVTLPVEMEEQQGGTESGHCRITSPTTKKYGWPAAGRGESPQKLPGT